MDKQRVDVVTYPTWSNPPRVIGDTLTPDGNNSPSIAPHTGSPAITVPIGYTSAGEHDHTRLASHAPVDNLNMNPAAKITSTPMGDVSAA
jgi:hypothetical protein